MLTKKQMLGMKTSQIVAYLKAEAAKYKGVTKDSLLFKVRLFENALTECPELKLPNMKLDTLISMSVYTDSAYEDLNEALEAFTASLV